MNKEELLKKALNLSCKWIRWNAPAVLPNEDFGQFVSLFAGGIERDPEGEELAIYFLMKAIEEEVI